MIEHDSKLSEDKVLHPAQLLKHTTELCNKLDELMALHHFFSSSHGVFF